MADAHCNMPNHIANARSPRLWLHRLAILVACAAVWGKTLGFAFVWDDRYYIQDNEALRSSANVTAYFTSAQAQKSVAPFPYRPLRTLHFALLTWPTGAPRPLPFHAANLAWHAAAALLLYALARRLLTRANWRHAPAVAFLTALGFAVHPLASEPVAWAKCLDDMMATTFILAAFLTAWRGWERARPRVGWLVLSVATCAASLYTKESAAALVGLLALLPFGLGRPARRPLLAWIIALMAVVTAYAFSRHAVLQITAQVETPISGSYLQTLIDTLPAVQLYAARMLGLPPFLPDYTFMRGGFHLLDFPVVLGATLLLALAALTTTAMLRCRRNPRFLPIACGGAWILLALVPVSNLIPMMQYFAERFAYLPLVGALLLAAGGVCWLAERAPRWHWYAGAVLLVWGATAFQAANKWRDGLTLMTHAFERSPPTDRITANYIVELFNAGHTVDAQRLIDEHTDLLTLRPKLQWTQARLLRAQGRPREALAVMTNLVAQFGDQADFAVEQGALYAETGDLESARRSFVQATEGWPLHANAWVNLGLCLNSLQRYDEAAQALTRSVELDPRPVTAWQGLLRATWQQGDWPNARRCLLQLQQLEPNNPEHPRWLARLGEQAAPPPTPP